LIRRIRPIGLETGAADGSFRPVARIPLVDPDDANIDPAVRDILERMMRSALGMPNVLRAMANHPGALRDGAQVAYSPGSLITAAHRELAYLTASLLNRCHY
jgi:alkylhydroperoxidase family enzyme